MQDDEIPTLNRRAGLRLRRLREAKELTQRQLEHATATRFGSSQRVVSQQVSRIEKGEIDKPPIMDLIKIGEILGLNPGEILELYGLWTPTKVEELDPIIREAISLQQHLPADLRGLHRSQIEFANLWVAAEARKRVVQE